MTWVNGALLAVCTIALFKWFFWRVVATAFIAYMLKKGYEPPNPDNIGEHVTFVLKNMRKDFKDLLSDVDVT